MSQSSIILIKFVLTVLVGSLIVFVARRAKEMVQSDAKARVRVFWKTVGFGTTKRGVERFLEEQGLERRMEKKELDEYLSERDLVWRVGYGEV